MNFTCLSVKLVRREDFDLSSHNVKGSRLCHTLRKMVLAHNFGFHPTGILRDAYVSHLNNEYEKEKNGCSDVDLSVLKINEIYNWMGAWEFLQACGYTGETQDY